MGIVQCVRGFMVRMLKCQVSTVKDDEVEIRNVLKGEFAKGETHRVKCYIVNEGRRGKFALRGEKQAQKKKGNDRKEVKK